jgi:hypothetical protein
MSQNDNNNINNSIANIFKPRNSNTNLKLTKQKKKLFKEKTIEECIKYSIDNLVDYDKDIEKEKLLRYLSFKNESKLEYSFNICFPIKNKSSQLEQEPFKISQLDENNNSIQIESEKSPQ